MVSDAKRKKSCGRSWIPEAERHAAVLAKRILRERSEVVNARDIRRRWKLPGLRTAERMSAALKALEEAWWLLPTQTREGETRGRQRTDYQVNPQVFEAGL